MISLKYKTVELPYKQKFATTHGTKKVQKFLYVELGVGALRGYGATPYIDYSSAKSEQWIPLLESRLPMIQSYAYNGPQRFWHFLHHLYPKEPYLVAALDMASWDLWGHWQRKSVRELMGIAPASQPTDITVGADDPSEMCTALMSIKYKNIKLKWTDNNFDELSKLSRCTQARLRLDPNEAWSVDTVQEFLVHPMAQRFDVLEQPCPADTEVDFTQLENPQNVCIIADESFQTQSDISPCAERFHGINIKLPKCGGLTPARDIMTEAKKLGLKILLGNMSEGQIGTAALTQISGGADFLDLDGALLLEDDTATGVIYPNEVANTNNLYGLGINVNF